MKASIGTFAPVFNTNRMVAEYVERAYEPAAKRWNELSGGGMARARELATWLEKVRAGWPSVKIHDVAHVPGEGPVASVLVQLHPGELVAEDLRVDAVFGPTRPGGELIPSQVAPLAPVSRGDDGVVVFRGDVTFSGGGLQGYAIRVLPAHPHLYDPFAAELAHWA
jgi:starch phosphorylase